MARQIYNDTWASGGDKVDPGAVKTTNGWAVEAPPREHFNFWQGQTDEMLQHLERSGIAIYDATTIYELGGYTREGTITYRSLVVTNTGNLPSTSPTEWVQAFLIPGNNLSDLADVATARTNLSVLSTAEGDAAYARLAIANTFTESQTIKKAAATSSLLLDSDTGFDTEVVYSENGVRRAQSVYDESGDSLDIIKYDTNGTTVKARLSIQNDGSIDATTGTLKVAGGEVIHPANKQTATNTPFTTTTDLVATDVNAAIEEVKALPSGVNWAGNTKEVSFTAEKANGYLVSGSGITVTLPASPVDGIVVVLADYLSTWDTDPITVSGGTIEGDTTLILDLRGGSVQLVFSGISSQWEISSAVGGASEILDHTAAAGSSSYLLPFTPPSKSSIDVYVGNVWQSPSAFTLTVATIDFGTVITGELRVRLSGFALPIAVPAAGSVGSAQLAPAGVDTTALATGAVTNDKMDVALDVEYRSGRKNLIINGNFDYWQRGFSFSKTSETDRYTADRWTVTAVNKTNTQVRGEWGNSDVRRLQSKFFYEWDVTASSGAGDIRLNQFIEARELGMLAGKTVTLTFELEVVSGLSSFDVQLFQNYSGSTVAAQASTPAQVVTGSGRKTLTFTMPSLLTSTTIVDDAVVSLGFIPTNNNTTFKIRLWNIQLELGAISTNFDQRPTAEELILCQRYYEKSYNRNNAPGSVTTNGAHTHRFVVGVTLATGPRYKVSKRVIPTVTILSTVTGTGARVRNDTTASDITVTAIGRAGENGFTPDIAAGPSADNFLAYQWTADAEL